MPTAGRPMRRRRRDWPALVEAAWTVFDRVAAAAPAELRKGPRGGGRDRAKIVAHVVDADHAYARQIGIRLPAPDPRRSSRRRGAAPGDARRARRAVRRLPLADRRWPARYAARRIAWHASTTPGRSRTESDREPV